MVGFTRTLAFCLLGFPSFFPVGASAGEAELVWALAFGSRTISCNSPNEPSVQYETVLHGSDSSAIEYSSGRGWGFEVIDPGASGFFRFGPFDDSANNRAEFDQSCGEHIYNSFIGFKNYSQTCDAAAVGNITDPCTPETVPGYVPEGGVFRIDVPNGKYRFVGAFGDASNRHAHRVLAEDGGSGPPSNLGANHVVLVQSYDQAQYGAGVFARVGFEDKLPPVGNGSGGEPAFQNMDSTGRVTAGAPNSPTLEVTQGYIRVHLLQGNSNDGPAGTRDPNGGDIVLLEVWRVDEVFEAISRGSTWKYQPGDQEASSPVDAWREVDFNDTSWPSGAAPFGYGEAVAFGTDISTFNPPMQGNYSAFFLRQKFELSDPGAVNELTLNINYDDAFAMWINGVEVARIGIDGLPGDPITHQDLALTGHESGVYEGFSLPDPAGYLVAGTNVVAVMMFNVSITSSDLMFDMNLVDPSAPDLSPPLVQSLVPSPGTTVRSLNQIQVTFDEDVVGVEASDLLINGSAATSVAGSGVGPYTFSFATPPDGAVDVEWDANPGIFDLAENPNAFTGGSWSYTLDPNAPIGSLAINEILASNRSGIIDENNDRSDWLEFVNDGAETVNTAGWSVTDDPDDPGKFELPSRSIPPGGYLVVFASGKDRAPSSGNIHCNWKLNTTGEYVGLFNAEFPRQLVSEIAPRYPRQRADYSYGRDGLGELVYFETPTPGAANGGSVAFDGFVIEPLATPARGIFTSTDSVEVTLTNVTPGATLRYTLDGSEPTSTRGTVYNGPITIQPTGGRGTIPLRIVAYKSGLLPSDVVTHSYVFPSAVLEQPSNPTGFPSSWNGHVADYRMDPRVVDDPGHAPYMLNGLTNIPTLSVVAHVDDLFNVNTGIFANPSREGLAWERPCSAELIFPDGTTGFQENCGIRIQGGSSTNGWKSVKVSARLLFKGDYGPTKLRYALFPDSPVTEYDVVILDAHLNLAFTHPSHSQRVRSQYTRDVFVSDVQNAMGGFAPHSFFANLYLNGLYWGMYELHERPDASFAASYFGGEKEEYDAVKHSGSNAVDGTSGQWSTMMNLVRRDLSSASNYAAVQDYLDVPDFIDYMITNFYTGNDDWPHHNWYATRKRTGGGLWRVHSWDAEHVLKDVSISRLGENDGNTPGEIWQQLRDNAEFRLLFGDHVHRHFFNGGVLYVDPNDGSWDPETPERNRPAQRYMARIDEINSVIACESARWGDMERPSQPYTRNNEWAAELNWLLNSYFPSRSRNVLNQFRSAGVYPNLGAPVFSRHGGRITPGFTLTMSLPASTTGTIYYTTDGFDPRVSGSGAVWATAQAYTGPITLTDHTLVRARTRNGASWSAINEAVFTLASPHGRLKISEINYNPDGGGDYEFLEVKNTGDETITLKDVYFSSGLSFVFSEFDSLEPGEFIVLVVNPTAFADRYPGAPIGGVFLGALDNAGEKITIAQFGGGTIDSVIYDDEDFWPLAADGFGHSLVRDDYSDAGVLSWRASAAVDGSPGEDDPAPTHGDILINEVLAHTAPPLEDAIELYNPTTSLIDISGWYLSDSRADAASLQKYRIPNGTFLSPDSYAVFYEYQFNVNPGSATSFELSEAGGSVYLASATAGGDLTGHIVEAPYGPQTEGVSFGRITTSEGPRYSALEDRTFGADLPASVEEFRSGTGADNAGPLFGPVVFNELMYHPENGDEEFIEFFNPTNSPIELHDSDIGRGWRVTGVRNATDTDSYEFAAGVEIPAQGYLVLTRIDPDLFRTLHGVPLSAEVVGPYGGALENGGETVRLYRPEVPDGGEVPFILVDQVRYDDDPPWSANPDGRGPSLERIIADVFGDDPANWDASTRDGGTPGIENTVTGGGGNRAPTASFTASRRIGEAPLQVLFDASQSFDLDGTIVRFDWSFDDGSNGVGQSILHMFTDPGVYRVTLLVTDNLGASDGAAMFITVEEDLGGGQVPGDANSDGRLDISDSIALLRLLFGPATAMPCGGDDINAGGNVIVLDLNDDATVNIADVLFGLNFLFADGPPPGLGTECTPVAGCPDVCFP